MTTLDQDTDRIGRTAASKLIDLINNPKSTLIEQVIIEGYLAEGESVRDLNP
jgi:LacI family transcriptional regulator/LacI family purine nucleotide synthesis repressor